MMDSDYILKNRREKIIQKCIAIAGWQNRIGQLRLKGKVKKAEEGEALIDQLIDELISLIVDLKL